MSVVETKPFPKGIKFKYIPYTEENADIKACGIPIELNLDTILPGKKVVIVSVPGAFTPTCTANHIPPFGVKLPELKAKGVDEVVVLSANDPFVLSAWGKALGLSRDIKFVSDPDAAFSKAAGLSSPDAHNGFGERTKRYALIVDNGIVTYVGVETERGVHNSGVDNVLAKL